MLLCPVCNSFSASAQQQALSGALKAAFVPLISLADAQTRIKAMFFIPELTALSTGTQPDVT